MNELQTLRSDDNDLNIDPEQLMKLRMFAKMISNNVTEDLESQKRKPAGITLQQLYERYMEDYARAHCARWRDMERCYGNYLSHWSDRDLLRISRAEVQQWHSELGRRNSKRGKPMPHTANRALELLVMMYRKASDWELISGYNPGSKIRKFDEQSRSRFLQTDELGRFFEALDTLRYETTKDFLLMCLLTGARRANVAAMKWSELNLEHELWTIPKTKNKTPQVVPLVPVAMSILRKRAVRRASASPWVFSSDRSPTGHLTKPEAAWKVLRERANLTDARIHDLRRTLASWEAITGANISAISATLNHKDLESTAIYARLNAEPVRKAMTKATRAMLKAAGLSYEPNADRQNLESNKRYQSEWITTDRAAEIIGTSIKQLVSMRSRNAGPPYLKKGHTVLYQESMLQEWLKEQGGTPFKRSRRKKEHQ